MYLISTGDDPTIYGPYDDDMSVAVTPNCYIGNDVEVWHIPTANMIAEFQLEGFSVERDIPEDSTLWNQLNIGGLGQ